MERLYRVVFCNQQGETRTAIVSAGNWSRAARKACDQLKENCSNFGEFRLTILKEVRAKEE